MALAPIAIAAIWMRRSVLGCCIYFPNRSTVEMRSFAAFEVLDCPLVFFGRSARAEGTQVPAPAGLWIFLSRVKAVLARDQLANHNRHLLNNVGPVTLRLCSLPRGVSSTRLYGHLVVDYDAKMRSFCELYSSRSHGFRLHRTRERHFIFRYIRANPKVSLSHLFVAREHGSNCFFQFGHWRRPGWPRPVGEEAA